jgi:hypothetical protein
MPSWSSSRRASSVSFSTISRVSHTPTSESARRIANSVNSRLRSVNAKVRAASLPPLHVAALYESRARANAALHDYRNAFSDLRDYVPRYAAANEAERHDMDHFKAINDCCGHATWDSVAMEICMRQKALREIAFGSLMRLKLPGRMPCAGRFAGHKRRNNRLDPKWLRRASMRWCPGEDSNLHELLHWYLKPARLPVPPPGQVGRLARGAGMYAPIRWLSIEAPRP